MSPRKSKKKQGRKKKKYKLKTHKATAKRFRRSGSGKILRTNAGQGHLRRKKSKRSKRLFDRMVEVESRTIRAKIRKLAPYLDRWEANESKELCEENYAKIAGVLDAVARCMSYVRIPNINSAKVDCDSGTLNIWSQRKSRKIIELKIIGNGRE